MEVSTDPFIPRMTDHQRAASPHRLRFDEEFKARTVDLVVDHGYTVQAAADAIGLGYSTVCNWVKKARGGQPHRGGVQASETTDVDMAAENRRLRSELARARMEVEILKKATAFFAKEHL